MVGGTVVRVLPGNFSCEVEWDNGQKGVYFQAYVYFIYYVCYVSLYFVLWEVEWDKGQKGAYFQVQHGCVCDGVCVCVYEYVYLIWV